MDTFIETQPKSSDNHLFINISDEKYKNEKKCKIKNRKFTGCLEKYNGNIFYCENYFNNYLECMGFIKL